MRLCEMRYELDERNLRKVIIPIWARKIPIESAPISWMLGSLRGTKL